MVLSNFISVYLETFRVGHKPWLSLQPLDSFSRVCFRSIDPDQKLGIFTFIPLANIPK